ncbi:MAG: ATP-binding protein [Burkholderiaceae bacterium]
MLSTLRHGSRPAWPAPGLPRAFKTRLNTRWLLTFGLTSMVVSILLVAQFIGLLPDPHASVRQMRMTLAEAATAGSIGRLTEDGGQAMRTFLEFLVERNPELLSATVRRGDGRVLVNAGLPAAAAPHDDDQSTIEEVIVPINVEGRHWGRIELRFEPLPDSGPFGFVWNRTVQLVAFLAIGSVFAFNLYLRRMLRHLDPTRAVPERVRTAFDTLTEAVVLTDADGLIMLANRAFAELTGVEPGKLELHRQIGSFAWLARGDAPLDPALSPWRTALTTGAPQQHAYLALLDSAGRRHSFQVNCSPIRSADDAAGGVLMSLEDITGLERIQAELHESKRQADDANRTKSEFLANMSHEIRTPMNAILGFTDVLRRGQVADAPRHLETIHRNARNLLDLINDILDLSKVESGRLEIERTDCAPHRLIQEVVEVLSGRAAEKNVALHFDVVDRVPASLPIDSTRLRQILTNLAGNAIKFTEHGAVRIIERWRVADGRAWLDIAIRDSGIGIPADKIDAIFEPFVQAEGSTTRRFGGTGLGLAISRKFARAMDGDISVASEPGRGSTFVVSLGFDARQPVALIDAAQAAADGRRIESVAQRDWAFAPARVLVVDDSPENRELVRLILSELGLTIVEAGNGRDAVDKVLGEPFDFVLMDVHMPVMDGYAAVSRLRAQQVRTPIVAFTADAIKGFERKIAEAGFSGYLTKPIDIDAMLKLLRGHLPTVSIDVRPADLVAANLVVADPVAANPVAANAVDARPAAPAAAIVPAAGAPLVSRLAGHPKLSRVVTQFAAGLPARLASMRAAADAGDWTAVAAAAHWLKGSAGSVGFDAFTQPARTLETAARQSDAAAALAALAEVEALGARVTAPDAPPATATATTAPTTTTTTTTTTAATATATATATTSATATAGNDTPVPAPERTNALEQA